MQEAKLTAPPVDSGREVSLHADRALIGATPDNVFGHASGSAFVFVRTEDGWAREAKLIPDQGAPSDYFGRSLSLSEARALVGVPGDDSRGGDSGSAYIFARTEGEWGQEARLVSSMPAEQEYFGLSVALSDDTAVVGAPFPAYPLLGPGAVYVFTRSDGTWALEARLEAEDGAPGHSFGHSVSLSGNRILVGAPYSNALGARSGAAYTFVRTAAGWAQETKLAADDGEEDDFFGWSVSLDGDQALVGLVGEVGQLGGAYLFTRNAEGWSQEASLLAGDTEDGDLFGFSVSLSWNWALVGAGRDDDRGDRSGAAYLYTRDAGGWALARKFTAADASAGAEFGFRVSLSEHVGLVGSGVGAYVLSDIPPVNAGAGPADMGYELSVFPNPSGGQGALELVLPGPGLARVEIYDMLGRRVTIVHEGPLPQGSSRFSVDGFGLKGAYFARAIVGELVLVRRFVLL